MIDLDKGAVTVLGRITDASNATLLAEVNGSKVVYKPIAGERPLWDFPDGNLAQREFAAYLISDSLGFDIVPKSVLREGPYGPGLVQLWMEPDPEIDIVSLAQSDADEIRRMALFDLIINNGDRKFGHILPVTLHQIHGCDHGVAFHVENRLRTVLWQWAGQEFLESEIELLKESIELFHSDSLSNLITNEEREASIARSQSHIEAGSFPFPSEDWPAVPWPPF